jgi:hypothetical protein
MTPSAPVPTPPTASGDTKLGIILRIGFFIFTAYLASNFLLPILYPLFGLQIAGTLGLAAAGLGANLLTLAIFDRRSFTDIGLHLVPASGLHLIFGIVLGATSAALSLALPLLEGTAHLILKPNAGLPWPTLAFYLTTLLLAAAGEEMIFHGYAFQFLIEKIGAYASLLPVAVIFGLAHSSNPHATALSVFNTSLWGALLGYAFLRSRDLWLPIGIHFGWNAVLPLFGVNLSGITIEVSRYFYKWDSSPLWSGGAYGPEGGLLTTFFGALLFYVLYRMPLRPQHADIAQSLNEPDLPDLDV